MGFPFTSVLLRKKRRMLKWRGALWRLSAHEKVCELQYFLSSHGDSLMAVEKELSSVVDDEVNGCRIEYLTRLFWKSRIIVVVSRFILDCVGDVVSDFLVIGWWGVNGGWFGLYSVRESPRQVEEKPRSSQCCFASFVDSCFFWSSSWVMPRLSCYRR